MAAKTEKCTIVGQSYSTSALGEYRNDAAYAGFAGGTQYHVYGLKFTTPEFVNVSDKLSIVIVARIGVGSTANLHWALCTSDANNADYANTTDEVADEYQIASGLWSWENMTQARKEYTMEIETEKLEPGETYYLLMWASEKTGVSVSEVSGGYGDHSVYVDYYSAVVFVDGADSVDAYELIADDGTNLYLCHAYYDDGEDLHLIGE